MPSGTIEYLTRIAIGAIASAVVSAGVLYFAFDHSLRGVETAIDVLDTSVKENGAWLRQGQDTASDRHGDVMKAMEAIQSTLTAVSLRNSASYAALAFQDQEIAAGISDAILATMDTIEVFKATDGLSAEDLARYDRISSKLAEIREEISELDGVTPAEFLLGPLPSPARQ